MSSITKGQKSLTNKDWEVVSKVIVENIDDLIKILLENRGVSNIDKFINMDYEKDLHSADYMPDMDRALKRIKKAIDNQEHILVYGDYDVDGITSSTLIVDVLEKLKIKNVKVHIPSRKNDGYGLNKDIIEKVADYVDLIITVDCGITNTEEVEFAKKKGIDVIITDHHEVVGTLPKAAAVINPKRRDSKYPFKYLAGVGVAFKLAQAIYNDSRFQLQKGQEKWLLDLVALGTVADCVPLLDENRILVNYGLIVLSKTKRFGLSRMLRHIGIDQGRLSSFDIGFKIAPRLNSAGRLKEANDAYELFISNDKNFVDNKINYLEDLNIQRKNYSHSIIDQLNKHYPVEGKSSLIEASSDWEQGVLGLAAGNLAEKLHKPVILFAKGKDLSVGSARCYNENINIAEIISENEDILVKYGGHANAAGLTIKNSYLKKFKNNVNKRLKDFNLGVPRIKVDAEVNENVLNIKDIKKIISLEPYGEGNPYPTLLAKNAKVVSANLVGQEKNHLKIKFRIGNKQVEGMGFYQGEYLSRIKYRSLYEFLFQPIIDKWNGYEKITLKIIDIKEIDNK